MTYTTFEHDLQFLKKYYRPIVLSDPSGKAQVILCPELQARVMTSTCEGMGGPSLGWINHKFIAQQQILPHINPYGGEDRFWLGPEGGQFSIFFKKGTTFTLDNCYTPAPIDKEPFETVSESAQKAVFRKDMKLSNYSGTEFILRANREINLLSYPQITEALQAVIPIGVNAVGFESVNTITNTGKLPWHKETGLLSIWILGMLPPSEHTTVIFPFTQGDEATLGPVVNAGYFGEVPADRLKIKSNKLFFKGDGKYRSKIGLSPARARPFTGSYDAGKKILTVNHFTIPPETKAYVNSMWELQKNPYGGDISNAYNDGPVGPAATSFGGFYELESSSPAAVLKPGESLTHRHQTFHFTGTESELDRLIQKFFDTSLKELPF